MQQKREHVEDGEGVVGYKRVKADPLKELNSLGLYTPPTTPEKDDRIVQLKTHQLGGTARNLFKGPCSPYSKAKSHFVRGSSVGNALLSAREVEGTEIKSTVDSCLRTGNSDSIYISGPPGTGKTAQVNAIINDIISSEGENTVPNSQIHRSCESNHRFRVINVNCMTIKTSQDILNHIQFKITGILKSNVSISEIHSLLKQSKEFNCDFTILILDEMDNVIKSSQQSLFELFSFATPGSGCPLLLIGIANALDLTDRFLPRLRSNCIEPKIIRFLPYTAEQIKTILTNKLLNFYQEETGKSTTLPPMVQPTALMFCAKKSAVNTGDLRKAFDIMYRSLDNLEQATLKTYSIDKLSQMDMLSLPKLTIAQVVKVCTQAFTINYQEKIQHLNFQQRIILSFLFKFEEREQLNLIKNPNKNKLNFASINSFFEYYNNRLKSFDNTIGILRRGEFLEIITALETQRMINLTFVNKTSNSNQNFHSKSSANQNQALNFGSFKISSNIPNVEFIKASKENEILNKIMISSC